MTYPWPRRLPHASKSIAPAETLLALRPRRRYLFNQLLVVRLVQVQGQRLTIVSVPVIRETTDEAYEKDDSPAECSKASRWQPSRSLSRIGLRQQKVRIVGKKGQAESSRYV